MFFLVIYCCCADRAVRTDERPLISHLTYSFPVLPPFPLGVSGSPSRSPASVATVIKFQSRKRFSTSPGQPSSGTRRPWPTRSPSAFDVSSSFSFSAFSRPSLFFLFFPLLFLSLSLGGRGAHRSERRAALLLLPFPPSPRPIARRHVRWVPAPGLLRSYPPHTQ